MEEGRSRGEVGGKSSEAKRIHTEVSCLTKMDVDWMGSWEGTGGGQV